MQAGLRAHVVGWSVRICKFSCFQETRRCRPLTRTLITSTAIRSVGELPASQSTSDSEPWSAEEVQRWEEGRRKLATIMGADPEYFSEREVVEALRYLLPSQLSASDALPLLKHPGKLCDKRKLKDKGRNLAFDKSGRPLEPAFYTGFPAYHNLVYQIFEMDKQLESQQLKADVEIDRSVEGEGGQGEESVKGEGGQGEESVKGEGGQGEESVEGEGRQGEEEEAGQGEEGSRVRSEPPKFWLKREALANILEEELTESQYREVVFRLGRLANHPLAGSITHFLDQFRRPHLTQHRLSLSPQAGSQGQVHAVGKRKCSVAIVDLRPGEGGVTVNSEPLLTYFPLPEQRQQVLFPLIATEMWGGVEVSAQVKGGGKTGQAGAIRLAISKALAGLPGQHLPVLEGAGLLVRDPRMVERKKPGQKKARKKFAWVKR